MHDLDHNFLQLVSVDEKLYRNSSWVGISIYTRDLLRGLIVNNMTHSAAACCMIKINQPSKYTYQKE